MWEKVIKKCLNMYNLAESRKNYPIHVMDKKMTDQTKGHQVHLIPLALYMLFLLLSSGLKLELSMYYQKLFDWPPSHFVTTDDPAALTGHVIVTAADWKHVL